MESIYKKYNIIDSHKVDKIKILHADDMIIIPSLINLKILDCSGLSLTNLPILPKNLTELYCYDNNLMELPPLPTSLHILYCYDNSWKELNANITPSYNLILIT